MELKVKKKYLRISPQKVRLVAATLAGRSVQEALDSLQYMSRAAARPLYQLVRSAVSNADKKGGVDIDSLYVKRIMVDQGPSFKRYMPRARGRADRITKRTSHVTLVLDERS